MKALARLVLLVASAFAGAALPAITVQRASEVAVASGGEASVTLSVPALL